MDFLIILTSICKCVILLTFGLCGLTNGQRYPEVQVQDTNGILGENSAINCSYKTRYGDPFDISVQWHECTSEGIQGSFLADNHGTNPNGRYSVDITPVFEPNITGVATLTIANTVLSDEGYYQCTILDFYLFDENNDFAKLDVYYIEDVMINISSNQESFFTMTCFGNSTPVAQLNLYHNGTIIKTDTTPLRYTINQVSEDDDGKYYCEASNIAGTVTTKTIRLDYYKPRFQLRSYIIIGSGGSCSGDVVIEIESLSANPSDVSYQWMTDGHYVRDTDTNPKTLSFTASDVDKATYRIYVTVTNVIGSQTESMIITVSTLNCEANKCTGLAIGMILVGIFVGAFGVLVGMITYTKTRQNKLTGSNNTHTKDDHKKSKESKIIYTEDADIKIQETYMEYKTGATNQTLYEGLKHGVEEESAYINVKTVKNTK